MEIYSSGAFEFIGECFAFKRLFEVGECEDFGLPCLSVQMSAVILIQWDIYRTRKKTWWELNITKKINCYDVRVRHFISVFTLKFKGAF